MNAGHGVKRARVLRRKSEKHAERQKHIVRRSIVLPTRRMVKWASKQERKRLAYAAKAAMNFAGIKDRETRKIINIMVQFKRGEKLEALLQNQLPQEQAAKFRDYLGRVLNRPLYF